MVIAGAACLLGGLERCCPVRLSFQLDILRLITRGLLRGRRVSR